jgi:hypothetical protein
VKFDGDKLKSKLQFLTTLKSTGQSKFALEDKDETVKGNSCNIRLHIARQVFFARTSDQLLYTKARPLLGTKFFCACVYLTLKLYIEIYRNMKLNFGAIFT